MVILPEPQPLLTKASKMPGLDGQKMSKSYNNTMRWTHRKPKTVEADAAPCRPIRRGCGAPIPATRTSARSGSSTRSTRRFGQDGCNRCRSAAIGCIECKQPVIDAVLAELKPIQERGPNMRPADLVRNIINEGCERAREVARETMEEVRHAMSIDY